MLYHLLALLTMAVWGTTFVSTKLLLKQGLTPADIFAIRFTMAYAGLVTVQALKRRNGGQWFCRSLKDEALMAIAGMTGGSLYFLTENTALEMALAGNVSLIVCMAPLFTALFALFVHSEQKADARLWASSFIAFAGVSMITYGSTEGGNASAPLQGNLLALGSAALWAVYQLVVRPLGRHYGTLMLTRKVFGYGVLTIIPFIIAGDDTRWGAMGNPLVWGNLVYLSLIASLACYAVWNRVVEKLGPLVSANYIYLNPLVTCIASYIVLGETFTLKMMFGGLVIVVGLYFAISPRQYPRPSLKKRS